MEIQEYPKALYLSGQALLVDDEHQEATARETGYDDWHADATRGETASAPEPAAQDHQADVEMLRETAARLQDWERALRERDEQMAAREGELSAREETVAAAEAALAKQTTAPPSDTSSAGDEQLDREALKARATELDLIYAANIKTEKLAELVAAAEAGAAKD